MPSFTTHCLCGDVAAMKIKSDKLRKIIKENRNAYLIGCQGPDIFMFYHLFPFQNQERVEQIRWIADFLHERETTRVFKTFIEKIQKDFDHSLIAYVAGFLCHHSLDTIAHPFVYWFTQNSKRDFAHVRFEGELDKAILDERKLTKKEYQPALNVKCLNKTKEKLAQFLSDCLNHLQSEFEVKKNDVKDVLTDFIFGEEMLNNPNNNKFKILNFLEQTFNKPGLATSLLIPDEYDNKLDAFNYRKEIWHNPTTNEASNHDFGNLFELAVQETLVKFEMLDDILFEKQDDKPLLELIGNRNFKTGLATLQQSFFKEN